MNRKRTKQSAEEIEETRVEKRRTDRETALEEWVPKTELGRKVMRGEIESIADIMKSGQKIKETEIVDRLIPELEDKLVDFTKTAKVRRAGRMFRFRASVIVGDKNRYIGLGIAKDAERWPAINKATRKAKLNLVGIRKGCGSWECGCGSPHSVPFKITGNSGSVEVTLLPAPRGTGLVVGGNIKEVLRFVGIEDVWSKTRGNTSTTLNFVAATIDALSKTTKMKVSEDLKRTLKG